MQSRLLTDLGIQNHKVRVLGQNFLGVGVLIGADHGDVCSHPMVRSSAACVV